MLDFAPLVPTGIRRLALATPFAVGRVNVYLIEDEPLTLIDAGANSADALVTIEAWLGQFGHRIEDLGLIVITHQHVEHFGLVNVLARRSGADVAALDLLASWLDEFPNSMAADDRYALEIMIAHGVPPEVQAVARRVAADFHRWGAPTTVTLGLADGAALTLRDRTLQVSHRPGHSPSDTVFHDVSGGVLFAGDHLIGHIASNPVLTRPLLTAGTHRTQSLVTYLASLKLTAATEVGVVLPGHGEPIIDHRGLIAERLAVHARRRARLLALIVERRRSAYDLARELWGTVAVTQALLTVSQVLGHVDLLLNEGHVAEVRDADGITRFEAR
jgi:glyoxylase-like metal-dependent hydrolase (beta-lactamase superfamily II)